MPKIIENLEANLIEEARKQISEQGYAATTIRSVARGCGVGVGTVYNYFPSKEALIANLLLGDWRNCIAAIEASAAQSDLPEPVVQCICHQLQIFVSKYQTIFHDETATAGFSGSFRRYHSLLRNQLSQPIRKFCHSDFQADFIAEALLTWTCSGTTFDELYGMIDKLF